MNYGNTFGSGTKEYSASSMPVWLEVKERKIGGGTADISGMADGSFYKAGTPIYLAKMGDTVVVLDAFEVDGAVTSSDTALKLKVGVLGTVPKKDMILGKLSSAGASTVAKAAALPAPDTGKTLEFTITANAFGELSDGDLLYLAVEAGTTKDLVLPSGLSWHDTNPKRSGDTVCSFAVVTKGQILVDRIPSLITAYKNSLADTGITFEKEL